MTTAGPTIPVQVMNASLPISGGGDATAANQVLELAQLALIVAGKTGAPNIASANVTAGAAATLVAARATRRTVTITNNDAVISVYIGPATVTTSSLLLRAGTTVTLPTTALIQVLAASGSPVVSYFEVYD